MCASSKTVDSSRAAIYARVSTGHQDPENQVLKLREFAGEHGYQLTLEYVDQESGRSSSRTAFRQMMHDARRRRFDTLLFFSFSRLTREGPQRTAWYLHELEQAGISYISVSERDWLDTTGKWAFVITMMMATIAQMEVDQLSARTRAGLDRARRQGKQLGRPRQFVDLEAAAQLRASGASLAEVSRRLRISTRTLNRRLHLPLV